CFWTIATSKEWMLSITSVLVLLQVSIDGHDLLSPPGSAKRSRSSIERVLQRSQLRHWNWLALHPPDMRIPEHGRTHGSVLTHDALLGAEPVLATEISHDRR